MKTQIYYYTGSGNSLWAARELEKKISGAKLNSIYSEIDSDSFQKAESLGLVFPVHIWGVPRAMLNFLEKLPSLHQKKVFAVAVNAGQVSRSLIQLDELLKTKASSLSWGLSIKMPSNYIPWGGPCSKEKQEELFKEAKIKLSDFSKRIETNSTTLIERGPLWQRIIFTWIYKLSYKHVPQMDKKFFADEKCDACGICAKLCPVEDIVCSPRPSWKGHCEQCLSCIQWCPKEAIQYGEKTKGYKRYHHPEIRLGDMLRK